MVVGELADEAKMTIGVKNTKRIDNAFAELLAAVRESEEINNADYKRYSQALKSFYQYLPKELLSDVESLAQSTKSCPGKWHVAKTSRLVNWLNPSSL